MLLFSTAEEVKEQEKDSKEALVDDASATITSVLHSLLHKSALQYHSPNPPTSASTYTSNPSLLKSLSSACKQDCTNFTMLVHDNEQQISNFELLACPGSFQDPTLLSF